MIAALLLGLVAGLIGRVVVPDDVLKDTRGPTSWQASLDGGPGRVGIHGRAGASLAD